VHFDPLAVESEVDPLFGRHRLDFKRVQLGDHALQVNEMLGLRRRIGTASRSQQFIVWRCLVPLRFERVPLSLLGPVDRAKWLAIGRCASMSTRCSACRQHAERNTHESPLHSEFRPTDARIPAGIGRRVVQAPARLT